MFCVVVMMFYDWRECVLDGCTDPTPQKLRPSIADPLLAIT